MPVHNRQPMTSTIKDLPGRKLAALWASVMFVYAYVDVLARQRLSGRRGLVVAAMLILAAIEFATADNYLGLAAETVLGSAFFFVVVRLVRRRRASKRRADGAVGGGPSESAPSRSAPAQPR